MAQERLQKILSEYGIASRRKAEELIAAGKVKVNGHPASLGDKADARRDTITVAGKKIGNIGEKPQEYTYVLLNKPRGVVTTLADEQGRKCVADLVADAGVRLYPIGRLDRDSEGLLLLTNDGEFANAVSHPKHHVPKTYRVTVRGTMTEEQAARLQDGIVLDGRKTAPAEVTVMVKEPERTVFQMTIYEGRNRQIRRMCESLGLEVIRLKRISIATVKIGGVPVGKWRYLEGKEVKALLLASGADEKLRGAAKYIQNHR